MRLIVQGRAPLKGTYTPSGNSNEAIDLIAASLLSPQPTTLYGVPDTASVRLMVKLAGELGAEYEWSDHTLRLHTPRIASRVTGSGQSLSPVAAILLQAPILAQREHSTIEWTEPLGRIHTHLTALRDLGIKVDIRGQNINLTAYPWQSRNIVLTETSVTATALVCMLAAVMGKETIIFNAASEPHLRSLQQMLVKMGVRIEGIGSNLLHIYGSPVESLTGVEHTILPGHIEIASIAAIAAMLPGHITIENVIPEDLRIIQKVYERLGINVVYVDNTMIISEQGDLSVSRRDEDVDVEIDTAPWPGFPSDLVAITTVAATQAYGTTLIHEKLFNNRLLFVDKLKAMGAQVVLADPHRAVTIGPTPLRGEYIDTPDVRIGLGLLGAALVAEGESMIDRAELIERNFEGVIQKLINLGAQITVEDA